jgi:hypothetical protein
MNGAELEEPPEFERFLRAADRRDLKVSGGAGHRQARQENRKRIAVAKRRKCEMDRHGRPFDSSFYVKRGVGPLAGKAVGQ